MNKLTADQFRSGPLRLALLALLAVAFDRAASASDHAEPTWTVYFSPHGGCSAALVDLIGSAQHSVHLAAYSFTSQPVTDALIAVARAGRQVRLVLDKSDRGKPMTARVRAGGVEVWIDDRHSIMHNKYIIIDGRIVETGSYNFTNQAENKNAENCLIVREPTLAKAYLANWQTHQQHASRP